jgi:iron complex transport system substrate-binding protein
MKTKTLVLIGIAVCTILLASPALASAGYSKIYGNANEDDVLDMRDVTYIKLVIFGKKPATTFADANNDGKVSMLDVGQTKLIILGKEKKITLVDQADRTVTVPRPIERVVSTKPDATRTMIALGECNKLVGICGMGFLCPGASWKEPAKVCAEKVCGGRLHGLPEVSVKNIEFIVSLKPDVVFSTIDYSGPLQKAGVPVVSVYTKYNPFFEASLYPMNEIIGKIMDKEKEAEELSLFVKETFDRVSEVTSQIPEEEKPKVYFASRGVSGSSWSKITRTIIHYEPLEIAGGINVADGSIPDPGTSTVDVSKEQIIAWNPDIILIACSGPATGGRERVLSDPDLQMVNAVKNERVYYCIYPYANGLAHARNLVQVMYLAKLFHPEKFKDLDVEEEGNEIFKAFLSVDGLFSEYADYRNWMREWLDSQK